MALVERSILQKAALVEQLVHDGRFQRFLKEQLATESLEFYQEATQWESSSSSGASSPEARKQEAQRIQAKYLDNRAPRQINVDASVRNKARQRVAEGAEPGCFLEAVDAIVTLLAVSLYPEYQLSPLYRPLPSPSLTSSLPPSAPKDKKHRRKSSASRLSFLERFGLSSSDPCPSPSPPLSLSPAPDKASAKASLSPTSSSESGAFFSADDAASADDEVHAKLIIPELDSLTSSFVISKDHHLVRDLVHSILTQYPQLIPDPTNPSHIADSQPDQPFQSSANSSRSDDFALGADLDRTLDPAHGNADCRSSHQRSVSFGCDRESGYGLFLPPPIAIWCNPDRPVSDYVRQTRSQLTTSAAFVIVLQKAPAPALFTSPPPARRAGTIPLPVLHEGRLATVPITPTSTIWDMIAYLGTEGNLPLELDLPQDYQLEAVDKQTGAVTPLPSSAIVIKSQCFTKALQLRRVSISLSISVDPSFSSSSSSSSSSPPFLLVVSPDIRVSDLLLELTVKHPSVPDGMNLFFQTSYGSRMLMEPHRTISSFRLTGTGKNLILSPESALQDASQLLKAPDKLYLIIASPSLGITTTVAFDPSITIFEIANMFTDRYSLPQDSAWLAVPSAPTRRLEPLFRLKSLGLAQLDALILTCDKPISSSSSFSSSFSSSSSSSFSSFSSSSSSSSSSEVEQIFTLPLCDRLTFVPSQPSSPSRPQHMVPHHLEMLRRRLIAQNGLQVPGIFRREGAEQELFVIIAEINGGASELVGTHSEDSLGSTIKRWFGAMVPRLLPNALLNGPLATVEEATSAIAQLDSLRRHLFGWLLDLLSETASHSDGNQMSVRNLSIVWSPLLFDMDSENPMACITLTKKVTELLCILIQHHLRTFQQV